MGDVQLPLFTLLGLQDSSLCISAHVDVFQKKVMVACISSTA